MHRAINAISASLYNTYRSAFLLRKSVATEEVGFNGQRHRKVLFRDLLEACTFRAIIETGTFTGNTTAFMARTAKVPVYTCELSWRFSILARIRLRGIPNVTFAVADSRAFLTQLCATGIAQSKRPFFYLDAHWHEDLPLEKELEIICNSWKDFVIMIDDFQVPGDNGYGYDSYGAEKILSLEDVFSRVFSKHDLVPFFPSVPSREETGFKRGCVVLARERDVVEILSGVPSLCKKELAYSG